jgi:hypothetical protein
MKLIFILLLLSGCAPRIMILHEGDSAVFDRSGRLVEYTPKPGSEQEKAELRRWWFEFDQQFGERK